MTVSAPTNEPALAQRVKASPLSVDWGLLLAVSALVAFGLMMVYSATFDWSYRQYGSPTTIFMRQVRSLAIGLAVMVFLARLDYHRLRQPTLAVVMMLLTVGLLAAVLVVGSKVFGAQRGFFNGRYQPSELAKLVTIVYLSVWLSSKGDQIRYFGYGMLPYGILVGVVAGLIVLQPDISAALTIVLVGATMFFLAGADLLQISMAAVISGAAGYVVVMSSSTGRARLADYFSGLHDLTKTSWHVQQAIVAVVNGGLLGRGLGEGYQKFNNILPTPHTDSIFAVVAEELGLVGSLLLILLFVVFFWRCIKVAVNAPDAYGAVLAGGLTCWLAYEAIINIAVMVAALPFAGNALPFISYGGSSLVVALAGVGILLSISRHDPDARPQRKTRAAVDLRRRVGRPRRTTSVSRGKRVIGNR